MTMLYTTMELITLASSNYHFLFCFCNFIIIFLFIGSSKKSKFSSSQHNNIKIKTTSPHIMNVPLNVDVTKNTLSVDDVNKSENDNNHRQENEVLNEVVVLGKEDYGAAQNTLHPTNHKTSTKHEEEEEEEEEQEQEEDQSDQLVGDDELRKKFEEFINKVNNEWRAENLRTIYS
ncbi:hypothetical protein RND81_12G121800 [Saponaria officinalis]|uniref:Uncharacterized protein n=1 Tax=Saponaria officinalis TaxID=3572 RepID=A0AAW1H9J4_SAPOF